MLMILVANSGKRRRYLAMRTGSKLPFRSRGCPEPPCRCLWRPSSGWYHCAGSGAGSPPSGGGSERASVRCSSSSVLKTPSASALVNSALPSARCRLCPTEPRASALPSADPTRSLSMLIPGSPHLRATTPGHRIRDSLYGGDGNDGLWGDEGNTSLMVFRNRLLLLWRWPRQGHRRNRRRSAQWRHRREELYGDAGDDKLYGDADADVLG